jgi:hypothetical protein
MERLLELQADARFDLVASPTRSAIDEALYFHRRLRERQLPFLGFVINRVIPDPALERRGNGRGAAPAITASLRQALLETFHDQQRLARSEARCLARLRVDATAPVVPVPELDHDVHDLRGLLEISQALIPRRRGRRNGGSNGSPPGGRPRAARPAPASRREQRCG